MWIKGHDGTYYFPLSIKFKEGKATCVVFDKNFDCATTLTITNQAMIADMKYHLQCHTYGESAPHA